MATLINGGREDEYATAESNGEQPSTLQIAAHVRWEVSSQSLDKDEHNFHFQ